MRIRGSPGRYCRAPCGASTSAFFPGPTVVRRPALRLVTVQALPGYSVTSHRGTRRSGRLGELELLILFVSSGLLEVVKAARAPPARSPTIVNAVETVSGP